VTGTAVRVVSYNVRSLRDDAAEVARLLREADPDVVAVQEAPRFARWRSKGAALAADAGLTVVTGGRPAGAMMLLAPVRVEVLRRRDVLLTKAPRLHQRGLALAHLRRSGREFVAAAMHLDVVEPERRRHVPEILAHLDTFAAGLPVVLAGDVNDDEGSPVWSALTERFTDAAAAVDNREWTGPGRRLDAVFVSPELTVRAVSVVADPGRYRASDHWPLVADLEFAQPRP
jgi:endonuclease/exonuclease/phosphatase family metal-dependent hydrolase